MRIIDHHDDLCEAYLQALGDMPVPETLKEASWIERDVLLDRDFALVLVDADGTSHRKYASYDRGNTNLSIFYLMTQPHGLSHSAVKVAACNLYKAAQAQNAYIPPDLKKIANARFQPITGFGNDARRITMKLANTGAAVADVGKAVVGKLVKPVLPGAAAGASHAVDTGARNVVEGVAHRGATHALPMPSIEPQLKPATQLAPAHSSAQVNAGQGVAPPPVSAQPPKEVIKAQTANDAAKPLSRGDQLRAELAAKGGVHYQGPKPAAAPPAGAAHAPDVSHGGNVQGAGANAHPAAPGAEAPVVTHPAGGQQQRLLGGPVQRAPDAALSDAAESIQKAINAAPARQMPGPVQQAPQPQRLLSGPTQHSFDAGLNAAAAAPQVARPMPGPVAAPPPLSRVDQMRADLAAKGGVTYKGPREVAPTAAPVAAPAPTGPAAYEGALEALPPRPMDTPAGKIIGKARGTPAAAAPAEQSRAGTLVEKAKALKAAKAEEATRAAAAAAERGNTQSIMAENAQQFSQAEPPLLNSPTQPAAPPVVAASPQGAPIQPWRASSAAPSRPPRTLPANPDFPTMQPGMSPGRTPGLPVGAQAPTGASTAVVSQPAGVVATPTAPVAAPAVAQRPVAPVNRQLPQPADLEAVRPDFNPSMHTPSNEAELQIAHNAGRMQSAAPVLPQGQPPAPVPSLAAKADELKSAKGDKPKITQRAPKGEAVKDESHPLLEAHAPSAESAPKMKMDAKGNLTEEGAATQGRSKEPGRAAEVRTIVDRGAEATAKKEHAKAMKDWEALPWHKRKMTPKPELKKPTTAAPGQAAPADEGGGSNWMPYAGAAAAGAVGASMLSNKQSDAPNAFEAIALLEDRWRDLDPYDRHDLAIEAVKVASAQGATVPDHIFRYSGEKISSRFPDYMRVRQEYTRDPEVCAAYERLVKVAEAIEPEELVETIFRLDDMAGLCQRYGEKIADPFLCVFDRVKEAGWSWNHGGAHITEDELNGYAASPTKGQMRDLFEDSFVDAFRKAPVEFFKKQSKDVQTIIARMASQSGVSNTGGLRIQG